MKKILMYIIYIAIPLLVGALSGFLTSNAMEDYKLIKMPPFSPAGAVFPIVWTILYVLMGTGAFLVYYSNNTSIDKNIALILYYLQLIMNFFWSLIFFAGKQYMGALIWILILLIIVIAMLTYFRKVSILAFIINVPLMAWMLFATYLNVGVVVLN